MKLCTGVFQAVLRRRDNIQAEFQAKNEALMSRKADQEAVSVRVMPSPQKNITHTRLPSSIPAFL